MKQSLTENEKKVVAFLEMIETQNLSTLENFYHPEIEQTEFPNAVTKNTAIRNLEDLKAAGERGKKILVKQAYEVKNLFSVNDVVILEAIWKAKISVPIGNLPAGGIMTAYFAQIFEFKDGKIFRQRNYDCFDPF